eukprot:5137509-Alexandrium_andersonii.AAC.1
MPRNGLRRPLAKLLPALRRGPPRRIAAPTGRWERARQPLHPSLLQPGLGLHHLPAVIDATIAAAEGRPTLLPQR